MENYSFEMLRAAARRNVRAAWLRVVVAVIVVIAGLAGFVAAMAPMINLVGFAVAFIVACVAIGSQVKNLTQARARSRTMLAR